MSRTNQNNSCKRELLLLCYTKKNSRLKFKIYFVPNFFWGAVKNPKVISTNFLVISTNFIFSSFWLTFSLSKWSYCPLIKWITPYPLTIGHPVSCDYGSPFSLLLPSWPNTTRAVWWVGCGGYVVGGWFAGSTENKTNSALA